MDNEQKQEIFEFSIDGTACEQLSNIGKWTRTIAVISWVFLALIALLFFSFGVAFDTVLNKFLTPDLKRIIRSESIGMAIAIVLVIVCVLGALYMTLLFNFGSRLLKATNHQDQQSLESAFDSYKTYVIIAGVIGIIGLLLSFIGLFN